MNQHHQRLYYLDAVRAFALLLGIVFHSGLSFMPMFMGWAVMDISTSPIVAMFTTVSHSFRMELFFLIAGFFGHMTLKRKGAGALMKSRFVRIAIPFIVGWFLLRPLIVSGWVMGIASMQGSVDVAAGLKAGLMDLASFPRGIFVGTHLWFLYYLFMIAVVALLLRQFVTLKASLHLCLGQVFDVILNWIASSRLGKLILPLSTAFFIWHMKNWGMDTPDKSLIPHWPALGVFAIFYAVGWMLERNKDLLVAFSQLTPERIIAVVVDILAVLFLAKFQFQPSHEYYDMARFAYVISYSFMMWSLVWITIGVFRKILDRPHRCVRYIADASYWLYLIHLPIVVWLQVAMAEWPIHWSLKIATISFLTIGVSLFLYDLFVRATVIGKVLNGQQKESFFLVWFKSLRNG